MEYDDFLKKKIDIAKESGFEINESYLNDKLFPFQKAIVRWALRKGKAAIFADTGLGKTPMQLEWAHQVNVKTNGNILILAPLAVAEQTVLEGQKFDIDVNICRDQKDVKPGINITNYEMLHHFECDKFVAIVLDESSILKSFSGKIRNQIISTFANTDYKLACTATPAPNDYMELGNHSEFLNQLSRVEMLASYFVHDGGDTSKWRLKGHAEDKFWQWLSSWAMTIKRPSDIGFDDTAFILPNLNIKKHIIEVPQNGNGKLFNDVACGLKESREFRKQSINQRVTKAAEIANGVDTCLIWCDYNDESSMLAKAINNGIEVKGADSNEHKKDSMIGFAKGDIKKLITKPSIAGFGMNWQQCNNIVFAGISHSYEQYYQSIRRCWRFGQKKEVNVHIVLSDSEISVLSNIERKEKDAQRMSCNMIEHIRNYEKNELNYSNYSKSTYNEDVENGRKWTAYLGDSIKIMPKLEKNSIDYSVFSPPFAELYTYTDKENDIGNCKNYDEFFEHFAFFVKEFYRIIKPGRLVSVHCAEIPSMKERDGVIGLKDFPGDLIRIFKKYGFVYHSKVVIWKDPLIEATRTKALGLLHKTIVKDSSMARNGIPDTLLTFRKPGINNEMISHPHGFNSYIGLDEPLGESEKKSHYIWQRYASPVWLDINQSNTLQRNSARDEKDEKHICPLQLDTIARAIELWSNENDIVFSPFGGIGSEGYQALKMNRRFVGIELKESYYKQMINNLKQAEIGSMQEILF